jgi:chromosome segregation ATPase
MADAEGVWFQPAVEENRAASAVSAVSAASGASGAPVQPAIALDGELDLLEVRVAEAADLVLRLREERAAFAGERETLLRECGELRCECESFRRDHDALRREREETAARLTRIIAKVDALRGEP